MCNNELTPEHTCKTGSDEHHARFYKAINLTVHQQLRTTLTTNPKLNLVKVNVDLMQVWLDTLPEEQRQHYTCNACKQYLNGFATYGHIDGDLNVQHLGLAVLSEEDRKGLDPTLVNAYQAVVTAFSKAKGFTVLTNNNAFLGDNLLGSETTNGWWHFALPTIGNSRKVAKQALSNYLPVVTEHGYSNAEITQLIDTVLEYIPLKGNFNSVVITKSSDFVHSHKGAVKLFLATLDDAQQAKEMGKLNVWAIRHLIAFGLTTVSFPNSAVGQFVTSVMKGEEYNVALGKYTDRIDPAKYMRPVALPTEKQFEAVVKELEEKGYAKCLPLRLASFDDLRTLSQHTLWERKLEKQIPTNEDIFTKQRQRLANSADEAKGSKVLTLATENVSYAYLVKLLQERTNEIKSVRPNPTNFSTIGLGSAAKVNDVEGGKIYKDGSTLRMFQWREPIRLAVLGRHMDNPERIINGPVDLIRCKEDNFGVEGFSLVYRGIKWKNLINSPIFPEELIGELSKQPYRRVIEDWCRTSFINDNPDGIVVIIPDTIATVNLGVGDSLTIEFNDNTKQTFDITSKK